MPGARIAQLVLSALSVPVAASPGKYWHPTGPEFSKVRQDPDSAALRRVSSFARYFPPTSQVQSDDRSVVAMTASVGADAAYLILRVLESNSIIPKMMPLESDSEEFSIDASMSLSALVRLLPDMLSVSGLVMRPSVGAVSISEDRTIEVGKCRLLTDDGHEAEFGQSQDVELFVRLLRRGVARPDGRWSE